MHNVKRSLIAWCLLGIMLNTYPAQTDNSWYNPIASIFSWFQNNVRKEYAIAVSALTAGTLASIYLYHKHKSMPSVPASSNASSPTPVLTNAPSMASLGHAQTQHAVTTTQALTKTAPYNTQHNSKSRYFVGHYFPAAANNKITHYFSNLSEEVVNTAKEHGFQEKSNSRPKTVGADTDFSQYHLTIAHIGEIEDNKKYHTLRAELHKGFIPDNNVSVTFSSIEVNPSKDKDKTTNLPIYNIMLVANAKSAMNADLVDLHNTAAAKIETILSPKSQLPLPPKKQLVYKPHVLLAKVLKTENSNLATLQNEFNKRTMSVKYTISDNVQMGGGYPRYEEFPIQLQHLK